MNATNPEVKGGGCPTRTAHGTIARRTCGFTQLALCLCGIAGTVGCRTSRPIVPNFVTTGHERVRLLTHNHFEKAALFMPASADGGDAPAMAPLVVVDLGQMTNAVLDRMERSVRVVNISGQRHEIHDYTWHLSGQGNSNAAASVEAYRLSLLLGADGFPIVARVVRLRAEISDPPLYFVSQSLEDSALARFGSPLPGRAFAVEASVASAPGFFVAGVFDDGPMPMGPYVYLDPSGAGVVTVLCRCAASQVDDFAMTAYYHLVDVEAGAPSDDVAARDEVSDSFPILTEVLRWPLRGGDGGSAPPVAPR